MASRRFFACPPIVRSIGRSAWADDKASAHATRLSATEPKLPEKLINSTLNYSYNTAKNRLTSSQLNGTDTPYTYDSEGQLKTQGATSYTFDPAHRLIAQGASSYTYDGVGNRIKATRNGVVTKYIYDAAGNLLAEANASNVITRYYIYGLGLTALVDAASNALYVYHHDGTGHTVALTNAAQQTVNTYAYDPYGRIMAQTEAVAQPFQYAGQVGVFAEGNNFYYMRARYYDANIGRFISEDPIGFAGGLNLYAYVGGNPVMAVDPWGLDTITINYYGGGVGHIGTSINGGPSYGYYGIGQPMGFLSGSNGQGGMGKDAVMLEKKSPDQSVAITVTQQQAQTAQQAIDNLRRDPGEYNLYSNNCATTAENILKQAGVPNVPSTIFPSSLIQGLRSNGK